MSSGGTNNQNIIPKDCTYGCSTRIYWNIATNEYWEVFTKKKHICPNRIIKLVTTNNNNTSAVPTTAATIGIKNYLFSVQSTFENFGRNNIVMQQRNY